MQADKMLPHWVWYFGGKIETLLANKNRAYFAIIYQHLQRQNCRTQKQGARMFISFSMLFAVFNPDINLSFNAH